MASEEKKIKYIFNICFASAGNPTFCVALLDDSWKWGFHSGRETELQALALALNDGLTSARLLHHHIPHVLFGKELVVLVNLVRVLGNQYDNANKSLLILKIHGTLKMLNKNNYTNLK